jgi:DNA-binding IclR family transcriptional regulator
MYRSADMMSKSVGTAGGGIQLVDKVAAVLDALAEHGELSVVQLAQATAEPRSSMYRLVGALERLGYVEAGTRRGSVRLGLRLFQLGSVVSQRFDVRQRALPPMEDLHRATGETIVLMIRRGTEAVCIERLDGRYVNLVIVGVGSSMPLHTGASPRALLAFAPAEVVDAALAGELLAYTRQTETDPAAVRRDLEAIRRDGYVISDEDVVPGVATVAAPIRDHRDEVVAAISLAGPRPTILEERAAATIALVLETASAISRALGNGG